MSLQKEAQGGDDGFTSNKLSLDDGQKLALCVTNHVFFLLNEQHKNLSH